MYNTIASLIIVYFVIIFAVGGLCIVSYLLRAFALYTIGKRQGKDNCFLAFIPYANIYFKGELSGTIRFGKFELKHPGVWQLVIGLVTGIGSVMFSAIFWNILAARVVDTFYGYSYMGGQIEYLINDLLRRGVLPTIIFMTLISLMSIVVSAVIQVIKVLIDYRIYKRYSNNNTAVAHAVLSALVPLYESICLFVLRNKPEVSDQQLSEERAAD